MVLPRRGKESIMETRVWIPEWKESSLNNGTYTGYIKSTEHIIVSSVDASDDLVKIETADNKTIIVMASDIKKAVEKVVL